MPSRCCSRATAWNSPRPTMATPSRLAQDAEEAAEAVLFGEDGDHPTEHLAEPLTAGGHDLAAAAGEGDAPWGGAGRIERPAAPNEFAQAEEDVVALGEPEQEEGLANVDFAAITGMAAPASPLAAGDAAISAEPLKKKNTQAGSESVRPLYRHGGRRPVGGGLRAWICKMAGNAARLPSGLDAVQFQETTTRADVPKPVVQPSAPVQRTDPGRRLCLSQGLGRWQAAG